MTGIAFLGIGVLVGELVATSRAANGISATIVVRRLRAAGAGDALGKPDLENLRLEPAWPSWLSPIGWGQQTFAFSENNLWPLLLGLGLAVVAAAARLRGALGARPRVEPASRSASVGRPARPTLRTDLGLAWRLQWPSLVGWAGGTAVLGFVVGSLATAVGNAVFDNPQIAAVLQSLSHTTRDDVVRAVPRHGLRVRRGARGGRRHPGGAPPARRGVPGRAGARARRRRSRACARCSTPSLIGLVSAAVVIVTTAGAALGELPARRATSTTRREPSTRRSCSCRRRGVRGARGRAGRRSSRASRPGSPGGCSARRSCIGHVRRTAPAARSGAEDQPDQQRARPCRSTTGRPTFILIAVAVVLVAAAVAAFRRRDLST